MRQNYADKIIQEVVKQLKTLRQERGLSHHSLAQKAGVTRSAISHIENGHRRPSLLLSLRLAHALNVKLAYIIDPIEKSFEEQIKKDAE